MKTLHFSTAFLLLILMASAAINAQANSPQGVTMFPTNTVYQTLEFPNLAKLPGFSAQLVANHLKLYGGYVTNTNAIAEKLFALLAGGKEKTAEYAELKRRFGWEFNGMRLHELYFGNIGINSVTPIAGLVLQKINASYGSFDAWKKDFVATGLMRGIGWVVLFQDKDTGRLFNVWINEHDGGHLAGGTPLLVMDVFEHAYLNDYQLDRATYIEAFFKVIDWAIVEKRSQ